MDLTQHVGRWTGTWKTWLRPDELHDESPISLEVAALTGGWILTYDGHIADDEVVGRMVIAANGSQIRWTDSWHTENQEQVLEASDDGSPSYTYGPDDETWTWSIDVAPGDDVLVITHFNAPPGMDPVVAVLMDLHPAA